MAHLEKTPEMAVTGVNLGAEFLDGVNPEGWLVSRPPYGLAIASSGGNASSIQMNRKG